MNPFRRKVVYSGSMYVDPALVQQWEEYAAISGQSVQIPGGADRTSYMRDRLKKGSKEAEAFRKRISVEYEAMKKNKEKPDAKVAESRARAYMKSKFKWK